MSFPAWSLHIMALGLPVIAQGAALTTSATLPPPTTFQDEAGTRFLTIEWADDGKVNLALRSVGGPGSYGRWVGRGAQTPKGIVFAQNVEDGEPGTKYLASGGGARLVVKINPGQTGAQDGGLVGTYHHISDEKLAGILKKDADAAGKKLDEALKLASRKAPADDKPAYAEWKRRWPELRERLMSAVKPKAVPASTVPEKEKPGAQSMRLAETTAAAMNFIGAPLPPGLQPGWEGIYEDGFGGTADLHVQKTGALKFELNFSRADGSVTGTFEGKVPAEKFKETPGKKEAVADFTDNNPEARDSPQTQIHFHRIGHFLVIETTEAQRYANKGWFDGVYVKRPPRTEE